MNDKTRRQDCVAQPTAPVSLSHIQTRIFYDTELRLRFDESHNVDGDIQ